MGYLSLYVQALTNSLCIDSNNAWVHGADGHIIWKGDPFDLVDYLAANPPPNNKVEEENASKG